MPQDFTTEAANKDIEECRISKLRIRELPIKLRRYCFSFFYIRDINTIAGGFHANGSRKARVFPRHFITKRGRMGILSCFTDEAGEQNMRAGYYVATLVFHNQDFCIEEYLNRYHSRLVKENLPDIPFHGVDLLHGHGSYEYLDVADRKRLLIAFSMLARTLPFSFHTFIYSSSEVHTSKELESRLRRDIVNFVFEHLEEFQNFESVAIYYDNGHQAVSSALHGAFDYALNKSSVVYKELSHQDKCLAQTADYLCTLALAKMRYSKGVESITYDRFFGTSRNLKQNFLKQIQKKQI